MLHIMVINDKNIHSSHFQLFSLVPINMVNKSAQKSVLGTLGNFWKYPFPLLSVFIKNKNKIVVVQIQNVFNTLRILLRDHPYITSSLLACHLYLWRFLCLMLMLRTFFGCWCLDTGPKQKTTRGWALRRFAPRRLGIPYKFLKHNSFCFYRIHQAIS